MFSRYNGIFFNTKNHAKKSSQISNDIPKNNIRKPWQNPNTVQNHRKIPNCEIFFFIKISFYCCYKKNLSTKKSEPPSELLDNFAFCDAAVFELQNIFIFLYFFITVGRGGLPPIYAAAIKVLGGLVISKECCWWNKQTDRRISQLIEAGQLPASAEGFCLKARFLTDPV